MLCTSENDLFLFDVADFAAFERHGIDTVCCEPCNLLCSYQLQWTDNNDWENLCLTRFFFPKLREDLGKQLVNQTLPVLTSRQHSENILSFDHQVFETKLLLRLEGESERGRDRDSWEELQCAFQSFGEVRIVHNKTHFDRKRTLTSNMASNAMQFCFR